MHSLLFKMDIFFTLYYYYTSLKEKEISDKNVTAINSTALASKNFGKVKKVKSKPTQVCETSLLLHFTVAVA